MLLAVVFMCATPYPSSDFYNAFEEVSELFRQNQHLHWVLDVIRRLVSAHTHIFPSNISHHCPGRDLTDKKREREMYRLGAMTMLMFLGVIRLT